MKSCETCKHSRKMTGKKCVKNNFDECAGRGFKIVFEYNHWEPINEIEEQHLPDELFEV